MQLANNITTKLEGQVESLKNQGNTTRTSLQDVEAQLRNASTSAAIAQDAVTAATAVVNTTSAAADAARQAESAAAAEAAAADAAEDDLMERVTQGRHDVSNREAALLGMQAALLRSTAQAEEAREALEAAEAEYERLSNATVALQAGVPAASVNGSMETDRAAPREQAMDDTLLAPALLNATVSLVASEDELGAAVAAADAAFKSYEQAWLELLRADNASAAPTTAELREQAAVDAARSALDAAALALNDTQAALVVARAHRNELTGAADSADAARMRVASLEAESTTVSVAEAAANTTLTGALSEELAAEQAMLMAAAAPEDAAEALSAYEAAARDAGQAQIVLGADIAGDGVASSQGDAVMFRVQAAQQADEGQNAASAAAAMTEGQELLAATDGSNSAGQAAAALSHAQAAMQAASARASDAARALMDAEAQAGDGRLVTLATAARDAATALEQARAAADTAAAAANSTAAALAAARQALSERSAQLAAGVAATNGLQAELDVVQHRLDVGEQAFPSNGTTALAAAREALAVQQALAAEAATLYADAQASADAAAATLLQAQAAGGRLNDAYVTALSKVTLARQQLGAAQRALDSARARSVAAAQVVAALVARSRGPPSSVL